MLALLSVWIGLVSLVLSLLMLVRRTWFTDTWLTIGLYLAIFSLTFAGMTLWALRKEQAGDPGVTARRTQCKAGIGLSLTAIIIVYVLVDQLARS